MKGTMSMDSLELRNRHPDRCFTTVGHLRNNSSCDGTYVAGMEETLHCLVGPRGLSDQWPLTTVMMINCLL